MTTTNDELDFSLLLASSVHDIKNSLSMLLSSLDEIVIEPAHQDPKNHQAISVLRGEAARINNSLIHLLGLYRLQHKQLSLAIKEVFMRDFLEEQIASQQSLFEAKTIAVTLECDDSLTAYFDEQLIAGVINNVLVNCAKYTRDRIEINADKLDSGVMIIISDNGDGYPQSLLNSLDNSERGVDYSTGSTNLGLYFAEQIALRHHCRNHHGSISVRNLTEGGGCFSLYLP